jgi:hypothetical protein
VNPLNDREQTQDIWNSRAASVVNALLRRLLGVGATASRPNNPTNGQMFYDSTLKIPVWWNTADAEWKDAAGTGV